MKKIINIMRPENSQYVSGLIDLINIVKSEKDIKTMIEVGSYVGESTIIFAKFFNKIYSVDPFLDGYDKEDPICGPEYENFHNIENQFLKNTEQYKNIIKIKLKYEDFNIDDTEIEFIYIDGLHTYEGVKRDIEKSIILLNNKGWIGGHDYTSENFKGVKKAVDEKFKKPHYIFSDTSWLIKL